MRSVSRTGRPSSPMRLCHGSLGTLGHVSRNAERGLRRATAAMSSAPRTLRNVRLLAASAVQHLIDDPALLVLQMSRRLPLSVRTGAGRAFLATGRRVAGGAGVAALGAFMAGDPERAEELLEDSRGFRAPLASEVAVLLDRLDLVHHDAAASTRARAAWARGDLSGAVRILDAGGRGNSPHARRLRSEMMLLEDGHRLGVPERVERGTDARPGRAPPSPASDHELPPAHPVGILAANTQHPDWAARPRHRLRRPDAHGLPGDDRQAVVRG